MHNTFICIIPSMLLILVLIVSNSLAKSLWDEFREEYRWPMAKILPKEFDTPIDCYMELDQKSIGHVFSLSLEKKDPDRECIIKVPSYVNIQFLEINFHQHDTYVRLMSGNHRRRMKLFSRLLTIDSSKDNYGEFPMACMHGYMVVMTGQKIDNLKFEIRPLDMTDIDEITEEMCNENNLSKKNQFY